jgi:phage terminase large subunit-like protein
LPEAQILAAMESLTDDEALAILYDWPTWARPSQLAPDWDWSTWLVNAGRGWGKTKTGAEWVRQKSETCPIIHLVAPTAADARDVMVKGPAGILAVSPPWDTPKYEPSKRLLTWPNGAQALLFSAEEPERLRGPQCHAAWCDEIAAWKYLDDTWDNLQMGLRLGDSTQALCTTTPRPLPLIKELLADPTTAVTRGSTFDNVANLSAKAIERLRRKYEGTRIGRQELYAEILDDAPGALWQRDMLEASRVRKAPDLRRIVVGVDPNVSNSGGDGASETGIIVAGVGMCSCKGGKPALHAFVIDDLSVAGSPRERGAAIVTAFHKFRADRVVAEINNGGDLVEHLVQSIDDTVPVTVVRASRGKEIRAEPISAFYEQGRVHHLGLFGPLEDQLCQWEPNRGLQSPDRLDALVWALTDLMLGDNPDATGLLDALTRM